MKSVCDKIRYLREAGNVRRCHIVPHLCEYTVGKHSYDAVVLLLTLCENPSPKLVKAVLFHDVAERWVGDMPSPAKGFNESLGREYLAAEQEVWERLGLSGVLADLTLSEREWLEAVDKLELWLWAHDQLALGNRHVETFISVLDLWFDDRGSTVPQAVRIFRNEFRSAGWRRTACAEIGKAGS